MSIDTSTDSARWLTYPEAAEALGIAPASVVKRATRRRWPRRLGNDKKARIAVPLDALPVPAPSMDSPVDSPVDSPGDSPPDSPPDSPLDSPGDRDALNRTIGRLEAENGALRTAMDALREERDAALARVADREALAAVLAVERARVEEWKAVADRFAAQAEALATRRRWWSWRRAS